MTSRRFHISRRFSRHPFFRLVRRVLPIAFLLCLAAPWCAGGDTASNAQWARALESLRTMPVQDSGFVRSAVTFGENHLMAIYGKRSFKGESALFTVLRLMADEKAARETPLIKIVRPELAALYGAKLASLKQYTDPALQEKFVRLVTSNKEKFLKPANEMDDQAQRLENLEEDFAIIPRAQDWLSPLAVQDGGAGGGPAADPLDAAIVKHWEALKKALLENDPLAGGQAASALAESVVAAARSRGIALPRLGLDALYHEHRPFAKSAFFYLLAALAYGAALLFGLRLIRWGGFACLSLGLVEQILGIAARWVLSGRAPLSNMYESFVFATAGMILVAIVFELANRPLLAGLGAGFFGFIFMVLAHNAPILFDSAIRPLVPALQSSWLTYHVVTIMLSYSAFALSFFVSVCYLLKDALGGDESRFSLVRRLLSLKTLDILNYKIIAVGFPLLTIGIILGAVWANTAWGRPWGFDPKEMWSAITWLIYAVYLHVRYFAGWRGRRAAVLAIIGFGAVLFTYLGVNYLLPSLHSYVS